VPEGVGGCGSGSTAVVSVDTNFTTFSAGFTVDGDVKGCGISASISLTVGINGEHMVNRNQDVSGRTGETRFEFNPLIAQFQAARRIKADVKDNFIVLNMLHWYLHTLIDLYGQIGCEPIVRAPFVDGSDQVRPCGGDFCSLHSGTFGKRDYLRMTFSDGVSASAFLLSSMP
jgi:hypothetical protein